MREDNDGLDNEQMLHSPILTRMNFKKLPFYFASVQLHLIILLAHILAGNIHCIARELDKCPEKHRNFDTEKLCKV